MLSAPMAQIALGCMPTIAAARPPPPTPCRARPPPRACPAAGAAGADRGVLVYDPRKWVMLDRWSNVLKYEVASLHFSSGGCRPPALPPLRGRFGGRARPLRGNLHRQWRVLCVLCCCCAVLLLALCCVLRQQRCSAGT